MPFPRHCGHLFLREYHSGFYFATICHAST